MKRETSFNFIGRLVLIFCSLLLLAAATTSCSKSSDSGEGNGDLTDQDLALGDQSRYGEGNIPKAEAGNELVKDVHFEYDSSVVSPQDKEVIRSNAEAIMRDSSLSVEVEGHCDKRGTADYNMALGERRAKAAASVLVSFGVPAARVSTISYGAEIPLDPASNEAAYAKNRRAHFALYRKEAKPKR